MIRVSKITGAVQELPRDTGVRGPNRMITRVVVSWR